MLKKTHFCYVESFLKSIVYRISSEEKNLSLLDCLWSLGASVRFLKAGISTGGAVLDGLPPRSGTFKNNHTTNTELTTVV